MGSCVRFIKKIWIVSWGCLLTLVLFFPITIAALLSSSGNLAFTLTRLWAWVMLRVTFVRVSIRGNDKIRKGQSYVIISNHQSQYDILSLVTKLGLQFRWVIKKELRKIPLFGPALYVSRNIFIDRRDTRRAMESIRHGMERLPPGASVMFFAEGTRSRDGTIREFKKGGFLVAVEAKLPILPVTVNGGRNVLPPKSLVFSPGRIQVVVGDPIDTSAYDRDTLDELIRRARDVIIAQFDPDGPAGE